MKYLAITEYDQGIIIDADTLNEAKYKLKKKLNKNYNYKEIKLIQLNDNIEKKYIVNFGTTNNIKGGYNNDKLHNIASQLNDATKSIINMIKKNNLDTLSENMTDTLSENMTDTLSENNTEIKPENNKEIKSENNTDNQPNACNIM